MKHLPSQVMLNSTNVNYTNPTLKNVLLPITKKKGTLFHLYSVCLVSCAKIQNTCYTHIYIYLYIYITYTLCIDIIVPFCAFVLATNTHKMIHCHILLLQHSFSRFWPKIPKLRKRLCDKLSRSPRMIWTLRKTKLYRYSWFFLIRWRCEISLAGSKVGLELLRGETPNQRRIFKRTLLYGVSCGTFPNDSDNTNLCWKSSSFSFIFRFPCWTWRVFLLLWNRESPSKTFIHCRETWCKAQVSYTSRAPQKHPKIRILDLRRHNTPLQSNMAPEHFWKGKSFSKDRILPPLFTFCSISLPIGDSWSQNHPFPHRLVGS